MISQERLKELLHYDPVTGLFTWKVRSSNRIHVGDVCNYRIDAGYVMIRIDGKLMYAHRLAWLYMTGVLSDDDLIDHEDTIKDNNKYTNLRIATKGQNAHNSNKRKDNTSGVKGVAFHKKSGKWMGQFSFDRKFIYVGLFTTIAEATSAVAKRREQMHGEFANHGC